MEKIVIIIPSRLNAERLPNKPLKLINNKEMILHVHDVAKSSNIGEVIVATPDQEILDLIRTHNGQAILTSDKHETGTDHDPNTGKLCRRKMGAGRGLCTPAAQRGKR